MSAETTPAIDRGAAALRPEAFGPAYEEMARLMGVSESGADWSRDMARKRSREVLAAALDVEEMARAIHASDFPDDDWDEEVHTGLRDECLKNARAVRAAILGADS